jgi:hypothetical protein
MIDIRGIIYDNPPPPLDDYVDKNPPYAVYDMWAQNGRGVIIESLETSS